MHGVKPPDAKLADCRLRAAREHHIRVAAGDDIGSFADSMQPRRAGRNVCNVGALESLHNRELTRSHIDDASGNHEGRNAARTAGHHRVVIGADRGQAADAGADCNANHRRILLGDFQSRILERHQTRAHAEMHKLVETADFLHIQVFPGIKALHFARYLTAELRGVKAGDASDAALAFKRGSPARSQIVAERGDQAETSNDYAAIHHVAVSFKVKGLKPLVKTDASAETPLSIANAVQ